jgi:RES domain-containing protein
MVRRVYRVCRAVHSRLDGLGAKLAGGRWNSPGHSVVYMAESVSLAVLENLVHMARQDFPVGYVLVTADIPERVEVLSEELLRADAGLQDETSQDLGDHWIERQLSAVLCVPSAVVSGEFNYLLNPAHPDFDFIDSGVHTDFRFDPRLFG